MKQKTLNDYKENIFSQYGEDGIVREILRRISVSHGVCVEFGAWDGVLLANTATLWAKNKWKGVLIEADEKKFKDLKKVVKDYDCIPVLDFVTPAGASSVENILKRVNVSFEEVKVLSIDIDGNEYHILEGLKSLRPSLIIAEHNPTIPPEMEVVSKEDMFFGSSARALTNLMKTKGYTVVAMTTSNCFFVEDSLISNFSDLDITFESLFDRTCLTYLITGYDGTYAFSQYPSYGMRFPLNPSSIEKGNLFYFKYSLTRVKWNAVKQTIKTILKNVIGVEFISNIKERFRYIKWKLQGMPVPAHGLYKSKTLKSYGKKYNMGVFIETGTAGGGTVIDMSPHFRKVFTIELFPTTYHLAKMRGSEYNNINYLEGDSGVKIKEILHDLSEPALFWLDAHYSGDGTARGAIDTPIVQELQSIFKHKNRKHVIVIDDAREFNGTHDYPELSELKKIVESEAPWYRLSQDNDLIIIEPK